jgi:hypothetical protein
MLPMACCGSGLAAMPTTIASSPNNRLELTPPVVVELHL